MSRAKCWTNKRILRRIIEWRRGGWAKRTLVTKEKRMCFHRGDCSRGKDGYCARCHQDLYPII